jgi:transposase InsO family protein
MSRKSNPQDNAACESFMKTLKYEEVLRNEYRDLADAFVSIPEILEKVYNEKRLHLALGYLPPVEHGKTALLRAFNDPGPRVKAAVATTLANCDR